MQTTPPPVRAADERPTAIGMLVETLDLIEFVPVAGPPAVFLVAPLVLLALIVAGPFLALLAIVAFMIAAAIVVGLACLVLASPYLLVRHIHGRRPAPRGSFSAPRARLVQAHSRRVAA